MAVAVCIGPARVVPDLLRALVSLDPHPFSRYERCMNAAWIAAVALTSCAGARASMTLPACIRAEAADHTSGVQEFTFDGDGNLTLVVELDNAGKELARTTLVWSPASIEVSRSGAFANVQRGVLGSHGELVDWTIDARHIHLRWTGTFAPVAPPATARFAFETYYHVLGSEPLLPLDTAQRGVWPRMRAFEFSGSVVLHIEGAPEAEDTYATYDRGHQTERSIGRDRGRAAITTTTTWRGDEPVEQSDSDGMRRTFASAHGHLVRLSGGTDVTFTYDAAGNLTQVHTGSAGAGIDVDVSRCAR